MKHITVFILSLFLFQSTTYTQSPGVNNVCCDTPTPGPQCCGHGGQTEDLSIDCAKTNVTIHGASDGTFSVMGANTYTVAFSNGNTHTGVSTVTETGLAPGTYTVTITDEKGCRKIEIKDIIEPPPAEIACCEEGGGGCSNITLADCNAIGGTWRSGFSCNSATGLCEDINDDMSGCCQFATDCDDTITEGQCINFGGTWHPGAVCNMATRLCIPDDPVCIPTLSQWGIILLLLLLLTLGSISIIRQRQAALATTGGTSLTQQTPLFDAALFKRIVLRSIPLVLLAIALISTIEGGIFARNIVGMVLSGLVLAYLVQFVLRSERKGK